MTRRTQAGHQTMLPLEKWIEAERTRSNAMRPIGEIAAEVVEKAGRPHEGGGGRKIDPAERAQGGVGATRFEIGKSAEPEGPASFAGGVNASGNLVDFLPAGLLGRCMDRLPREAFPGLIVVFMHLPSQPDHATGSEDGTWISF